MQTVASHATVGEPLVGQLPPADLVNLWSRTTSAIVKYGFAIQLLDLEPPRTGTFDGRTITIDPNVDFEMQCFILLHLFGHSVQWVAPSMAPTLDDLQHTDDRDRFLRALRTYEFDAARLGMQLMHECGISDLDQWYSDFVETDWRYVRHYYQHDEIPDWDSCRASGCPMISPMPIPQLQHRQVDVRFAF